MIERVIEVPIVEEADVNKATRAAFGLMAGVGFLEGDQVNFATAISELTRNVVKYACDGNCIIQANASPMSLRVEAVVRDFGPGISDLDLAMQRGYSTGGTFGRGLPGVRNLVDEFKIESSGRGTEVAVSMERRLPT